MSFENLVILLSFEPLDLENNDNMDTLLDYFDYYHRACSVNIRLFGIQCFWIVDSS